MRTYEELDNEDIGFYLYCWFPQHMPGLIAYLDDMALAMIEDSHKQPEISGVSADEMNDIWLKIHRRIQHDPELKESAAIFAERLFTGKIGIVVVSCIVTWVDFIQHVNPKFAKAVKFFFENRN